MRRAAFGAGLIALGGLAGVALAQTVSTVVDTSQFQTKQQAAAQSAADIAAAQAGMPVPCGTVPASDTLNGTIGTGSCFTRPTDTRPTVVQAQNVPTDGSGAFTGTWSRPFASATPYINAQPINPSASQPVVCNVASTSATTFSGKCWTITAVTLPGIGVSLLNLVLPTAVIATAVSVRVAARDTTQ